MQSNADTAFICQSPHSLLKPRLTRGRLVSKKAIVCARLQYTHYTPEQNDFLNIYLLRLVYFVLHILQGLINSTSLQLILK